MAIEGAVYDGLDTKSRVSLPARSTRVRFSVEPRAAPESRDPLRPSHNFYYYDATPGKNFEHFKLGCTIEFCYSCGGIPVLNCKGCGSDQSITLLSSNMIEHSTKRTKPFKSLACMNCNKADTRKLREEWAQLVDCKCINHSRLNVNIKFSELREMYSSNYNLCMECGDPVDFMSPFTGGLAMWCDCGTTMIKRKHHVHIATDNEITKLRSDYVTMFDKHAHQNTYRHADSDEECNLLVSASVAQHQPLSIEAIDAQLDKAFGRGPANEHAAIRDEQIQNPIVCKASGKSSRRGLRRPKLVGGKTDSVVRSTDTTKFESLYQYVARRCTNSLFNYANRDDQERLAREYKRRTNTPARVHTKAEFNIYAVQTGNMAEVEEVEALWDIYTGKIYGIYAARKAHPREGSDVGDEDMKQRLNDLRGDLLGVDVCGNMDPVTQVMAPVAETYAEVTAKAIEKVMQKSRDEGTLLDFNIGFPSLPSEFIKRPESSIGMPANSFTAGLQRLQDRLIDFDDVPVPKPRSVLKPISPIPVPRKSINRHLAEEQSDGWGELPPSDVDKCDIILLLAGSKTCKACGDGREARHCINHNQTMCMTCDCNSFQWVHPVGSRPAKKPQLNPHDLFLKFLAEGGQRPSFEQTVKAFNLQNVVEGSVRPLPHTEKVYFGNTNFGPKPQLVGQNVCPKLYAALKLAKPDVAILRGLSASPDLIALANQICLDEKWYPDVTHRHIVVSATVSAVLIPSPDEIARYRQHASNEGYAATMEASRLRRGKVISNVPSGLPVTTRLKRWVGMQTVIEDPLRLNAQH